MCFFLITFPNNWVVLPNEKCDGHQGYGPATGCRGNHGNPHVVSIPHNVMALVNPEHGRYGRSAQIYIHNSHLVIKKNIFEQKTIFKYKK